MSSKGKKSGNFISKAFENVVKPFAKKDGNFFENMFTGLANVSLQTATGGMVGYNGTNVGLNQGVVGEQIVNGVKTVTGAKAAEEANAFAREQFENAQADAERARLEGIAQQGRDQLRQSRMAAGARAGASARANGRGLAIAGSLGDERDFLGV